MAGDIERRLAHLERELERINARLADEEGPWWERIRGSFKDDPLHQTAMRIARAERRRPRAGAHGRS